MGESVADFLEAMTWMWKQLPRADESISLSLSSFSQSLKKVLQLGYFLPGKRLKNALL